MQVTMPDIATRSTRLSTEEGPRVVHNAREDEDKSPMCPLEKTCLVLATYGTAEKEKEARPKGSTTLP